MRVALALLLSASIVGMAASSDARPGSSRTAVASAPPPQLVFSSSRTGMLQVYALDPVRNRLSQLTFGGDDACPDDSPPCGADDAIASPDGRLVAYVHGRELWVVRPDGTGRRRLAVGAPSDFMTLFGWSPDSERLAFTLGGVSDRGVRVVTADGRRSTLLGFWFDVRSLSWSPDGRLLAVQFRLPGAVSETSVELAGIGWMGAADEDETPQWRPSGKELALSAGGLVRLASVDGTGRLLGKGSKPRWSPDGTLLAYVTDRGVRVVEPDRGGRQVLEVRGKLSDPTWSPDGSRIAARTPAHVLVAGLRPRSKTVIPDPSGIGSLGRPLTWSPDGTFLVYRYSNEIHLIDIARRRTRLVGDTYPGAWMNNHWLGGWLLPSAGTRLRPAEPLGPIAAGRVIRFREPITYIAADGPRVAIQACQGLHVWEVAAGATRPIDRSLPPCGVMYHGYLKFSLALAGANVAWGSASVGGNTTSHSVFAGSLDSARPTRVALPGSHFRHRVLDERAGFMLGHGPLLVFSTLEHCSWSVLPVCTADDPRKMVIGQQSLWRLREPGYPGACPATDGATAPGRCQLVSTAAAALTPLAVDDARIVVRLADGSVALLDPNGVTQATVPFAPGAVLGAELDGRDLVVLVRGRLLVHDANTGSLIRSWPLPDVPSAGFCGLEPSHCGSPRLRLDDLAGGIAAYVLDGQVHLLRLADGTDVVAARGHAAQLERTGLFVADDAGGRWPGRVRFTPFAELPLP